jgi:hypothetical protein
MWQSALSCVAKWFCKANWFAIVAKCFDIFSKVVCHMYQSALPHVSKCFTYEKKKQSMKLRKVGVNYLNEMTKVLYNMWQTTLPYVANHFAICGKAVCQTLHTTCCEFSTKWKKKMYSGRLELLHSSSLTDVGS